jgi:hypothetical protein
MNQRLRITLTTALLALVVTTCSYGWGAIGHMAVAYVAYNKLTTQTRNRVDALVRLNPKFAEWSASLPAGASAAKKRMMLFMIAATWSDQIKGDGQHTADGPNNGNDPPTDGTAGRNIGYSDRAMHKYWHFIDMPFSRDGTKLQNPSTPNAGTQIPILRATLASNSPDSLKSYDLVWLAHIVGDVHQPLHCTSRFGTTQPNGDEGGNSVNVCNPQCNSRLHSFWDDLPGSGSSVTFAVTVGQGIPSAPAVPSNVLDPAAWIAESFTAAKNSAYTTPIGPGAGPFTLTTPYKNSALTVAKARIALAGTRLANILNKELK